jgi:hypothetical protein
MAVPIQNLRSGTATKRPVASGLAFGQVAVNYNEADPAVYLRGDANALIKVSPVFVGTGAPNATPASGGSAGNSKGEQWLDTASSPPTPKVWDGSAFVSSYTFTSGTTLQSPILINATLSGASTVASGASISGAVLVNAVLSGTTSAPTAASGDSSTSIATTAFVSAAVSGVAKLDTVQTFTAVQTLTDPAIIGTILEDVFTISDGAAFEVDPGNGSIQVITLGASRTPKATNFAAGEAVTLMVDDGSAYTLTWTDATWGGSGVVWKTNAGAAPTLNTTGYTVITFWKVGTQIYGARVGDA